MRKLRVVLADDEIMIREGFKKLFDWGAHDCEVVGEAADGVEALGVIDSLVPDIVIMDINIPIMNGLKVIQTSRLKYPDMAFIVNDCWNCTVYAGASGRRNQLECSRGNISSERTVYQPALQE